MSARQIADAIVGTAMGARRAGKVVIPAIQRVVTFAQTGVENAQAVADDIRSIPASEVLRGVGWPIVVDAARARLALQRLEAVDPRWLAALLGVSPLEIHEAVLEGGLCSVEDDPRGPLTASSALAWIAMHVAGPIGQVLVPHVHWRYVHDALGERLAVLADGATPSVWEAAATHVGWQPTEWGWTVRPPRAFAPR